MRTPSYLIAVLAISLAGCCGTTNDRVRTVQDWKAVVRDQLPLLGHRNWILVVDKAFPAQNAEGIVTVNTDADLIDVVKYTLRQVDSSTHVKPIMYCDAELVHITNDQVNGIDAFRTALKAALGKTEPQVILHDSVFVKIDEASKLFKILVLKTNGTIPYSSVFLQLDCKYWTAEKEKELRHAMKALH